MKDPASKSLWYRNAAKINVDIHKRMLPTISGTPILKYFDGPVMVGYQEPPKPFEVVYCRATPIPESCLSSNEADGHSNAMTEEGRALYDPYLDRHLHKIVNGGGKHIWRDDYYVSGAPLPPVVAAISIAW